MSRYNSANYLISHSFFFYLQHPNQVLLSEILLKHGHAEMWSPLVHFCVTSSAITKQEHIPVVSESFHVVGIGVLSTLRKVRNMKCTRQNPALP